MREGAPNRAAPCVPGYFYPLGIAKSIAGSPGRCDTGLALDADSLVRDEDGAALESIRLSQERVSIELQEVTMRATQTQGAELPARRSDAVAVATAIALALCVFGPSNLRAEPPGLTAADFVRIPKREVDLEAAQERHDARAASRGEAVHQRIFPQGAAPRAAATSSAAALERQGYRNPHQGVPRK